MKNVLLALLLPTLAVAAAFAGDEHPAATPPPEETPKAGTPAEVDDVVRGIDAQIEKAAIDKNQSGWRTHLTAPQVASFDPDKTYLWRLETSKGEMLFRLRPDVAPMHVTSTIYLTRMGFYDNLGFHRVITAFMAQGGDPLGNGMGGPGYEYGGEFSPAVKHDKPGLLSMANAGPKTDGSQFFITFVATPWLDGKHTIFGEIVEGMEALKALEAAGSESGRPKEALKITHATIEVR